MYRWTVLGLWLLVAAPLAAAGGEGEANIFAGDLGNAVWTVVIFTAVVLVLGKYAWGPLLQTLQDRESFIRDSLAQAKADREAAEARLAEYSKKLHQARAEASEIVEEGRRDAEVVKIKIEEEARREAERAIERAKREIDIATQTAVKELYRKSASLATQMASQIVRKELTVEDHERLIAESIAELSLRDTH